MMLEDPFKSPFNNLEVHDNGIKAKGFRFLVFTFLSQSDTSCRVDAITEKTFRIFS